MIGALLLVLLNLGALRLAGRGPSALGFDAPLRRGIEFAAGLAVAAAFAALQYLLLAQLSGFDWTLNPAYGAADLMAGLRWNLGSVLFEELIWRGFLLWLAIRLLGPKWAVALSAAAFGIYHWFSFEVFGDPGPMVYVFAMTGLFGAMLAYAFVWSRSIFLPVALHLGWNLVTNEVFSNGPQGQRMLVVSTSDPALLGGMEQLLVGIVIPLALPVLVLAMLAAPLSSFRRDSVPGGSEMRTSIG